MPNITLSTAATKPRYKQWASMDFNFVVAYEVRECEVGNSFSEDRRYYVRRPDSIRFTQGTELTGMLKELELYRIPRSYSSDSGKYEIEAKYATKFLDALIAFKSKKSDEAIYGQAEVDALLNDLKNHHYLTSDQVEHYKKAILADVILEDREKIAEENRDCKEAVALANIYKDNPNVTFHADEHALCWLSRVVEYKPASINIEDIINIKEFISHYKHFQFPEIFDDRNKVLLDALKETNKIISFCFGYADSDPKYVNRNFAEFLAASKSIKSLNMSASIWQTHRLRDVHMKYLGYGLRYNKSLEELDLMRQDIGDNGLITLLDNISVNPDCKLVKLNLPEIGLTDVGAKALIEFLKNHKRITWINVCHNSRISKALLEEIDRIEENNKQYALHAKELAKISPQNPRRYQEQHGTSKKTDMLYHQSCIRELQDKMGITAQIDEHKKAIAMIEPQNARRFAERNCLFQSKKQALAYHGACIRELDVTTRFSY